MYRENVYGALYGFAIGDAMGATTEFMSKGTIKEHHGRVEDIIGGGWLHIEPGRVTDDTEMMLAVYRGIKATGDRTERALTEICKAFRDWLNTNPIDIGGACFRAISSSRDNDPDVWMTASERRQKAIHREDLGNGGLMRCLVPCLLGSVDLARDQSRLTHNNKTCNLAVTIYYEELRAAGFGDKLHMSVQKMQPRGAVTFTLNNALYHYEHTDTFREAITQAVNDGGDADTIAALTGGLAGAFYGYNQIPQRWISQLLPSVKEALNECAEWIMTQI